MARNPSANEDILYKCTIDEIRLRVISDLQENYKIYMNIHDLLCISVYGGSQVRIHFCTTLTKIGRMQEVGHSWFMINIVTLNLKLAY